MDRRGAGRRDSPPYDTGLVAELKQHPLVLQAASIAAVFHQDPVAMMRGTWLEWQVRLAAVGIHNDAMESHKPNTS